MSSKAAARRRRKARNAQVAPSGGQGSQMQKAPLTGAENGVYEMPTKERHARGTWAPPAKGQPGPHVDLAADMIGRLHIEGAITTSQEQAARLFQELRAGFEAELGVPGYGSCFNDSRAGHDGGDGNPEAITAWRRMEQRIGRVKSALLQVETAKGADQKPNDMGALRNALDCVNG